MKISTKGRYALRMLLELSCIPDGECMPLSAIANKQNISKKYLEQIVPMLSKSGILRTIRGNRGGYALEKIASECTVGDVLRATEGTLAPVSCLEYETNYCLRTQTCSTLYV